jgi:outer membrane protein TolC
MRFAAGSSITATIFIASLLIMPVHVAGAGEPISLKAAVLSALESNDMLRAEGARSEAARSRADYAKSYLYPKVVFEERFMRTDNPGYDFMTRINQGRFTGTDLAGAPGSFNNPEAINDFQTSLSVEYPLYVKKARLGYRMAGAEAVAVDLDVGRTRENITHEVYRAFLGALMAGAYLDTAKAAEHDAAEHLRLASVMEQSGVGLASDRLRAQVAAGEAARNRIRVENDVEIARRGLGLVMGVDQPVEPTTEIIPDADPDINVLSDAVENRADIRAMAARVENGETNVQFAAAGYSPNVALFGAWQANDHNMPLGMAGTSYRVGAALSWTIFDGAATAAQKAGARAELALAESMFEGMKREARFRVAEAALRLKEARQSLAIAEAAVKAAEEGVRLIEMRYENGLAPMVALLDAQTALDKARSDAVRVRMELLMAHGDLRHRAGTLLSELTGNGNF